MPTVDETQKAFNSSVEDSIRDSIGNDIKDKNEKTAAKAEHPEGNEGGENPENKKSVESDEKKSDTKNNTAEEGELFDSIVSKIITEEFGGDEAKRDEAKGIANLAIKTFGGDPIKGAKSYKSLFDQTHHLKSVIKQNPFIERMINEANQGKTIDENYAKSLLGTATSADQPKETKTKTAEDQLDFDTDDFDLDNLTPEILQESGILDKTKYDAASAIDRRDMLEKARIRYGYKVLPSKMAERTVKLTQKKQQEAVKNEQISTAKETNKERLRKSQMDFVTKFNVDFDGNPEHKGLFEEIFNKAVRLPDIDDESGMLVASDAFEQAAKHVFKQRGLELGKVGITEKTKDKDGKELNPERIQSNSADIMRRILNGASGFKGTATNQTKKTETKQTEPGNDLNSRVKDRVETTMNRNFNNTRMISGLRKTDRHKS